MSNQINSAGFMKTSSGLRREAQSETVLQVLSFSAHMFWVILCSVFTHHEEGVTAFSNSLLAPGDGESAWSCAVGCFGGELWPAWRGGGGEEGRYMLQLKLWFDRRNNQHTVNGSSQILSSCQSFIIENRSRESVSLNATCPRASDQITQCKLFKRHQRKSRNGDSWKWKQAKIRNSKRW